MGPVELRQAIHMAQARVKSGTATIKFDYRRTTNSRTTNEKAGSVRTREVRPYKISKHKGQWALFATDLRRGSAKIRMYYLDEMVNVQPGNQRFRPLWPVEIPTRYELGVRPSEPAKGRAIVRPQVWVPGAVEYYTSLTDYCP